jgi:hypothetical protein
MANAALTPHELPPAITQRLQALRRQVTTWFWIDGLGRVLLWTMAIFGLSFLMDWYFHLDRSQRSVLGILMLVSLAVVVYRKLILPLSSTVSDDALLLQIEDRHQELGQSLISAAQFSRMSDFERQGISRSMVTATILHGVNSASKVDFGDALNRPGFYRNAVVLCLGVALAIGLGAGVVLGGEQGLLSIWFNRNLLLGDAHWPQKTYLEVQGLKDGVVVLPRGENWTQVVKIREDSLEVPEAVYIDFAGYGRPPQSMKKVDDKTFETVFTNVIEEFRFRARGGDALTEPIQVKLVEPPAAEKLTLSATLPAYTGNAVEELPAGKGPYHVIPGSKLQVTGVANKPLSKATLVIEPDLLTLWRKVRVASEETKDPTTADVQAKFNIPTLRLELPLADSLNFAGELAAWSPKAADKSWDVHLAAELAALQAAPKLVPGKYTLELVDEGGLASKRPATFVVLLKDDREPRFADARVVGVSGMIVPQAKVPYVARVSDDFSITKLDIGYRARGEESDAQEQVGAAPVASAAKELPGKALKIDDAFEVSTLKLLPGSSLTLFIAATDNDDVHIGGPKLGKSADFALRVVTEEQLRADLLRREREQRQEFERLLKTQKDLLIDLSALAAGISGAPDFADEQRLQLMGMQKRQNLVGTSAGGVANVFEAITIEVLNNRLEEPGGKLETRLRDSIIAPMRKIGDTDVEAAVLLVEKARRVAADPAERDKALTEAQEQQKKIVATMQQILKSMSSVEEYQDAINALYELEKAQKDVLEQTRREKEERIRRILQQGGKVPEEKPAEVKPMPPSDKPTPDKPAETPTEKPAEKSEEKPADEKKE